MRERAEGLGGSLEIESSPGAGAGAKASVPLRDPEGALKNGLAPDGALPG
jgi:hypothetical protein